MRKILIAVAMLLIGIVAGVLFRAFFPKEEPEVEVVVPPDTVFVPETVVIEKPVPKYVKVTETKYVRVTDTLWIEEDLMMSLPWETKTYGDERYTAVVSGYEPSLDRLEIYLENQVVTKYLIPAPQKEKKHSLYAGLGVSFGNINNSFVGVPLSLEYGYQVSKHTRLIGRAEYDLVRNIPSVEAGVSFGFKW